jgi:glucose/arabinose dehydrogenase
MQALLVVCAAAAAALSLATAAGAYDFVQVATGFDQPVYVTTAPNDPATLYVVERAGDIRIVRDGQPVGTFLDIRSQVWSGGEGGLLSVAFHPKYAQNHLFYVAHGFAHRTRHRVQLGERRRGAGSARDCSSWRRSTNHKGVICSSAARPYNGDGRAAGQTTRW